MKRKFTERPGGYTGCLLLRCNRCGQDTAFCAKTPIVRYHCRDCGSNTPLENLIPAYVRCEKCGTRRRYLSNVNTGETASLSCINCQAPIDLEFNKKKGALVTM